MLQESELTPYHCSDLPCEAGPWLVVAPHADDESFGMGGTLLKAQQAGLTTHVLVLTDGALGGNTADLVAVRKLEAQAAARVLGVQEVHFFEQPDRGLRVNVALQQRLKNLITQLKVSAVFFPGALELHPDHRTTALLAWQTLRDLGQQAPRAIAYEITGQSPVNCLVDITLEMPTKTLALAQYHSQLVENNYVEIVKALNKLRTLTLPTAVQWAEGFYCYESSELQQSLSQWLQQRVARALL